MRQARVDALPGVARQEAVLRATLSPPQSRRRLSIQDGPVPAGRRRQPQHGLPAQPHRLPRARVRCAEKRQDQQRR